MLSLSLARWSHAAGYFFTATRIYLRGYIWTPLVVLRKRYPTRLGYWGR